MILGSAWSIMFKKPFFRSLAPAFFSHILLVMISGMLCKRLSVGIFGGIVIAVAVLGFCIVRESKGVWTDTIRAYGKEILNSGGIVFIVFYVLCFILNTNKIFLHWDEFSHWGPFLKESLRLDQLYCMSPVNFAHKDYVPAVTIFETIWCRLGFRYTEPDAYRAIQVFMFSLFMPLFEKFYMYASEQFGGDPEGSNNSPGRAASGQTGNSSLRKSGSSQTGNSSSFRAFSNRTAVNAGHTGKTGREGGMKETIKHRFLQVGPILLVLMIPLIFHTGKGFCFYHSICCDVVFGVLFYWCLYEAYRDCEDYSYQAIVMGIGLSVFVLCKMTAMALFPVVVVLLIGNALFFSGKRPKAKEWVCLLAAIALPLVLWSWYNHFVDNYVANNGGVQSYDGMKLSSLADVFTDPAKSPIPYLSQVKAAYVDALIHRGILIRNSYLTAMLLITVLFVIIAFLSESSKRVKIIAAAVLTSGTGVGYALLMYFLYATAFSESEAVNLASYERYMNSFVLAAVIFLVAVYFDSEIWKRFTEGFGWIVVLLAMDLLILHRENLRQIPPGNIAHDEGMVEGYSASYSDMQEAASVIMEKTEENESIYIIKRGDMGDYIWRERYYCSPRTIEGGNIGPAVDAGNMWSTDLSPEEFAAALKNFHYIYFAGVDDAFIEKYSSVFDDPSKIKDGAIYRIHDAGAKVGLE